MEGKRMALSDTTTSVAVTQISAVGCEIEVLHLLVNYRTFRFKDCTTGRATRVHSSAKMNRNMSLGSTVL